MKQYSVYEATGLDGRKYIGCKGWYAFSEFEEYETSCTDSLWQYSHKIELERFSCPKEAALAERAIINERNAVKDEHYANKKSNLLYKG